jgi:thiamine pyrophosphokinase
VHILVFANGAPPEPNATLRLARSADLVLCADGGTHHARALGINPHVVIGDMDSLAEELRAALHAAGTQFQEYPAHKDETDLELALLYAAEQGATQITVVGVRGGRIDHELANLLLLAHPRLSRLDVRFIAEGQEIRLVRERAWFQGVTGDLLSLLPIGGDAHGITTSGLEYPLCDETLQFGPARGISNVFSASEACVSVRSGLLLAVHTSGHAL